MVDRAGRGRLLLIFFVLPMCSLVHSSCLPSSNYILKEGACIYRATDEGALDGLFVRLSDCEVEYFEVLTRRNYARDADTVWYKMNVIPGADAASFEAIPSPSRHWPYARDRHHVYFKQYVVLGADPKTFRSLRPPYAIDGRHAYCGTIPLELTGAHGFMVLEDHMRTLGGALKEALREHDYSAGASKALLDRFGGDTWVISSWDGRARAGDQIFQGCRSIRVYPHDH